MKNISITGTFLRACGMLVLAMIGTVPSRGQDCPPDEKFPYLFCYKDDSGVLNTIIKCASDPYHATENGKPLTPYKRPIPGCITIEEPRRSDVWMETAVKGSEPDSTLVFQFDNQFADIYAAFNQWGHICPPTGNPDCCLQIFFVHDSRDWPSSDRTSPMIAGTNMDQSTCAPDCYGRHRIFVNDTPDWLYGKKIDGSNGKATRSFYTGQSPPDVLNGYETYSLYQLIECATGRWFGLVEGVDSDCPHPFRVVANPLSEMNGPPMDLTPDDICQFKKLYCDHEVGLGVQSTVTNGSTLSQNVPNPFSTLTTIPFSLAKPAHVKVMIHDERGALIETLIDESMESGTHAIGFNGAGLPAGTYWYSLYLDGTATARKMILVK